MSKRDYLEKLQEYLRYELPERLVRKNISYYAGYFEEQKQQGKTEAEISGELGDPQLIARSCIDAEKSGADGIPNSPDDVDFSAEMEQEKSGMYREEEGSGADSRDFREKSQEQADVHTQRFSGWGCLAAALIIGLILSLIVSFLFSGPGLILMAVIAGTALIGWVIRKLTGR